MTRYYVDTETIGLYGVAALIQYASQEPNCPVGPTKIINVWNRPVQHTLDAIQEIASGYMIAFNSVFDCWHLNKLYNMFAQAQNPNLPPSPIEMAHAEITGRGGLIYSWHPDPTAPGGYCPIPKRSPHISLAVIPHQSLDLMILAKRGALQSTQERKNIRIRNIPTAVAPRLKAELEALIRGKSTLPNTRNSHAITDIHFARAKRKKLSEATGHYQEQADRWHIQTTDNPELVNVILKFKPTAALKPIIKELFGEEVLEYPMPAHMPQEKGTGFIGGALMLCSETSGTLSPYQCPYLSPTPPAQARAWRANYYKGKTKVTRGLMWPALTRHHAHHWTLSTPLEYARNDVRYLTMLYDHWECDDLAKQFNDPDSPCHVNTFLDRPRDIDSELTAYIAATRYRGFETNLSGIIERYHSSLALAKDKPKKNEVLASLPEIIRCNLPKTEKGAYKLDKTQLKKADLAEYPLISKLNLCRQAEKESELLRKLIQANGRLQVSVKSMGTLTHRVAGADDLNATAIQRDKSIRKLFTLIQPDDAALEAKYPGFAPALNQSNYSSPDPLVSLAEQKAAYLSCPQGEQGTAGDFESFEVVLAEAVYVDSVLNRLMRTCERCFLRGEEGLAKPDGLRLRCGTCGSYDMRKVHAIMGMLLYPGTTYEQVVASKGSAVDMYTAGKTAVFCCIYGGDHHTINNKQGIPIEIAEEAYHSFFDQFPEMLAARMQLAQEFTSLHQAVQYGRITYRPAAASVANLFGYKRYFHLENSCVSLLYHLAQSLPQDMVSQEDRSKKIVRSKFNPREQTLQGATQTALYGAAFGLQGVIIRAATNMVIQSTGAVGNKILQYSLNHHLQPRGINPWAFRCFQVHDSDNGAHNRSDKEMPARIKAIIMDYLAKLRAQIEFLAIEWNFDCPSLAD